MSDVKWIKITTDIFDDEKILLIETLPEADTIITIWFKLLCLAGKQNNCGVFTLNDKIAYTPKMLATIFRRKESSVELAMRTFEEFGMIQIVEGVITIPNWSKHQTLDQIEERRNYMKDYMAKYREKQKELSCKVNSKVNSKSNVNSLEKEIEKEEEIEYISLSKDNSVEIVDTRVKLFESFWNIYPKKVGKQKCLSWFTNKSRKVDKELVDQIIDGVKRYMNTNDWQKENGKYIPNPYTFLNQGRWEDDIKETISINEFSDGWFK